MARANAEGFCHGWWLVLLAAPFCPLGGALVARLVFLMHLSFAWLRQCLRTPLRKVTIWALKHPWGPMQWPVGPCSPCHGRSDSPKITVVPPPPACSCGERPLIAGPLPGSQAAPPAQGGRHSGPATRCPPPAPHPQQEGLGAGPLHEVGAAAAPLLDIFLKT